MAGPAPVNPFPDPVKALEAAKAARAELDTLIAALETKQDLSAFTNKNRVLSTQLKLNHAIRGPLDVYLGYVLSNVDYAAISACSKLKIYEAIGDGEVTAAEVSKKTGVSGNIVDRLLKILATLGLSREVRKKTWVLEEPAKLFYHPTLRGPGGVLCEGWGHTAAHLGLFLQQNPNPTKSHDCTLKFVLGKTCWEDLNENPDKAQSFSIAMETLSVADDCVPLLADLLQKSGRATGKFVDIGAGSGHVCNRLAARLPDLTFEVQDVHPHQFHAAQQSLPTSLTSRIIFKEHSFFTPQSPDPAAVAYFARTVLHDWADDEAITIIRTIVPALEANPNASFLINDMLLRDFDELDHALDELDARRFDMCMMVYNGSMERDRGEWVDLLKKADERLELVGVVRHGTPGSSMALLEVKLNV